ncbi:hypothetical protein EST38_g5290 [Candolleomyces aberdarensis]|uniref:G domain-containing protein n=1 Tax=Candolleomyces aberdarensis TaxID=2316362 RepID=A0A4V1Q420_9AGAR|nr:hypothetical protein EST38_g5290 [Candolleomyces aberdarensis]
MRKSPKHNGASSTAGTALAVSSKFTTPSEAVQSDIVILVVGSAGSGKSTFINYVVDAVSTPGTHDRMEVYEGLEEQGTRSIHALRLQPTASGQQEILHRVVLVDGPGLKDGDYPQHLEVVKNLRDWLATHYGAYETHKLRAYCGILYIQDISVSNVLSSASVEAVKTLLSLGRAVRCDDMLLATMKWGKNPDDSTDRGLSKLKEGPWKQMIDAGIQIHDIKKGKERENALGVIDFFLKRQSLPRSPLPPITLVQRSYPINDALTGGGHADDIVILMPGTGTNSGTTADIVLKDGREDDIVIPEKLGESSCISERPPVIDIQFCKFINRLLDDTKVTERMEVKDTQLRSCTQHVQPVVISEAELPSECGSLREKLSGRRIVLVDTPGFDDTCMGNGGILVRVAAWLEESYRKGMLVGGVIYLHNISCDSFGKSAVTNLKIFERLCGVKSMKMVKIVTTKWDVINPGRGEAFLEELEKDFWKLLLERQAVVHRVRPEQESSKFSAERYDAPWEIVDKIVEAMMDRDRTLQIQHELVEQKRFLKETEAGATVRAELKDRRGALKDVKKAMKKRPMEENDDSVDRDLNNVEMEMKMLDPTLAQRFKRAFGLL